MRGSVAGELRLGSGCVLGLSGLAPLAEAAFTFMVMSSDESEVLL